MPIQEYKCKSCGEVVEIIQKNSDPPLTVCTNCRGPLVKIISAGVFNLKGSGFYRQGMN